MVPQHAQRYLVRQPKSFPQKVFCGTSFTVNAAAGSQTIMNINKRLKISHHEYRLHLTKLLSTAGEIMEGCKNQSSKTDDVLKIVDLVEQLDWKKTVLLDLHKHISAGIGDDDLEAEILENAIRFFLCIVTLTSVTNQ